MHYLSVSDINLHSLIKMMSLVLISLLTQLALAWLSMAALSFFPPPKQTVSLVVGDHLVLVLGTCLSIDIYH